ncbi:GntR family transcriptional regulator [Croceibacterium sp. LX-88]|uniref:GntR family transcriptional regulator n=1 Tax=Croceibacterium selenioxidans TaxID=2838833 RepID=A0ABS5W4I4_9SPHN|nr:GntR family transcriptional regulator [Croceibacterium selenioxidans]MBT2134666.1 GntR family transcriptional regulator [Croceibacterium selenioxidans]
MKTADKIYTASTSEDAANARLADRLARRIEDDIVSNNVPAGGAMGSLRELSERYSVGRAAVREGVALLERRGLGRLRPGPCGGFIVAQPDVDTIATELTNYFRAISVTSDSLLDAREAVDLMAASLAASEYQRAAPSHLLTSLEDAEGLQWHLRVRCTLAQMSGEPVVQLFVTCLNDLTLEFAGFPAAGAWRDSATRHVTLLDEALMLGEADTAMVHAQSLNRDLARYLRDDEGQLARPVIEAGRQDDDRTLAILVARRLAADISRNGRAGERLGSEWDLCERYSVSRATLRQAIRQLQDSGLVECRRGRGNGLVVRDLRGTGGIRLMLAFLISHQMDPKAAGTILFQLNRFIPALAVHRAGPAQRAQLRELLTRAQRKDPIDRYDLLRLVQHVSHLAESPIIDLFSRCLAAYEARFHPFLAERLPVSIQTDYFDLLSMLLDRPDPHDEAWLEWAKGESSQVMLAMSRNRPI